MGIRQPSGRKRRWKRLLLIVAAGAAVVLVAVWLTFQHIPSWYAPAQLDAAGVRQARASAAAVAEYVSEELVAGQTLEVILSDVSVNEWLAALPESMPSLWREVPPALSAPAVAFEEERIRLGALYREDGWTVLVNLSLRIELSADRAKVRFSLEGVSGGSLGVPRPLLEKALEKALRRIRSTRASRDPQLRPALAALRRVKSVEEFFTGVEVVNRFRWPNGNRWFSIQDVRMEAGELRLLLRPL